MNPVQFKSGFVIKIHGNREKLVLIVIVYNVCWQNDLGIEGKTRFLTNNSTNWGQFFQWLMICSRSYILWTLTRREITENSEFHGQLNLIYWLNWNDVLSIINRLMKIDVVYNYEVKIINWNVTFSWTSAFSLKSFLHLRYTICFVYSFAWTLEFETVKIT